MRILLATALLFAPIAPAVAAAPTTCRDDVKAIVAGLLTHGPYEMTSTMQIAGGEMHSVAEVVPGVGVHTRTTGEFGSTELTIVGDRMWRHSADTGWAEEPLNENHFANVLQTDFFEAMDEMVRPRCDGLVTRDGAQYLSFGMGVDIPDTSVDVTLLVAPGTRRIERVESHTNIAGHLSSDTVYYRYDPTLTVTAPLP